MMNRYFLGAAVVLTMSGAASAASLSDVKDGVELFMINNAGWPAVHCSQAEYEKQTMVYCHPSSTDKFGGLFLIENEPKPVIYPINGKAKQYLRKGQPTLVNTTPIDVRQWTGDRIDISAAIKATLASWW